MYTLMLCIINWSQKSNFPMSPPGVSLGFVFPLWQSRPLSQWTFGQKSTGVIFMCPRWTIQKYRRIKIYKAEPKKCFIPHIHKKILYQSLREKSTLLNDLINKSWFSFSIHLIHIKSDNQNVCTVEGNQQCFTSEYQYSNNNYTS